MPQAVAPGRPRHRAKRPHLCDSAGPARPAGRAAQGAQPDQRGQQAQPSPAQPSPAQPSPAQNGIPPLPHAQDAREGAASPPRTRL
jgi:hypothetical protein